MTTKKALKEQEKQEAIDQIKKYVKPGNTLYTVLRNVSRSGMYRHIDLYAIVDNEMVYLSGYAATALDWPRGKDGAIGVSGCGMDIGFHLVYNLGWAVFGKDGYECVGQNCPNNDHVNDRNAPRGVGVHHTESGYALRQQWI
jgi:hypothetical protein